MPDYTFEKALRAVQKPGRYTGCEPGTAVKDRDAVSLRFAFCFPDTYEIGMSHLGLKVIYDLLNRESDIWCERAFAPWFDMREQMQKYSLPLFALESKDELSCFDVLGFTLQYELSYTNVLYMLELAGIPLLSKERGGDSPIIIAGGPCTCNPEPMADFIDLFVLGEGEEVTLELCRYLIEAKRRGLTRRKTLNGAAKIPGVYAPSCYAVDYNPDGTVAACRPHPGAPARVSKRMVADLDGASFPEAFPVPLIEVVHDRATVEVLRGCVRGCRFCQAGFIYRPFRARSAATIDRQARNLCANGGFSEVSLTSLSTSDHPELEPLLDSLLTWTERERVNLSLPSLRIDNFSDQLIEKTTRVRKSGLTFAPEAGTQRLRDVINKNITENEIMTACRTAFEAGYLNVKLYFMIGLPTETDEDIVGIADLAKRIVDLYYSLDSRQKGKSVAVNISVACFIPKPFTPFQYFAQNTPEEFERKQNLLRSSLKSKKIQMSWHGAEQSHIEAVLARGDRRLGRAILEVYRSGGIFDSWDDGFSYDRWLKAIKKYLLDPEFYANRERPTDETMPWDIFDYGVERRFLAAEYRKAARAETTAPCSEKCAGCGVAGMCGGKCLADR